MNLFGYSAFGFIFAIAILVTVHEFGHFYVARKLGVKVLKFSVGFGKPLFRWHRKNDPTEYCIAMIPLGGYVKMLDEREGEVEDDELNQAFNRKSLWVRSAVVIAGPLFNFLFAIIAIWFIFITGNPDIKAKIGYVQENSIAEQAGFKPGDVLISVDDKAIHSWSHRQFYTLHKAMQGERIVIKVSNSMSGERELEVDFSALDQSRLKGQPITFLLGIWPEPPEARVTSLVEGAPAQLAGLIKDDLILSVEDVEVRHWGELVQVVSQNPGRKISLMILRANQTMEIELTTKSVAYDGRQIGQIGLYQPPMENMRLQLGPIEAIGASMEYNWYMMMITLKSIGRMLTAQMSVENLSGPIGIALIAGKTVESGYIDFIKFLAIISVSLGVLNLLPIPVLDGGHLMYFAIEAITGKEPSEKLMLWSQQFGIAMLLLLMLVVFYNDIMRLL